jgi:hypothetical protein
MSSTSVKLQRLRGWFVVYFLLKSVVGAVVAAIVLKPAYFQHLAGSGLGNFSNASLLAFSLMVTALILAVALIVFAQLLRLRNWARVLLLVIGWLTVISAVFSLLASSQLNQMGSLMFRLLPDLDWEKLVNFDHFQKVFEFLFWGYLIAVLQFDDEVRKEFYFQPPAEKKPGE